MRVGLAPVAAALLGVCPLLHLPSPAPARALQVDIRPAEQTLQRQLYAPPPPVQSFSQQLSDAQPFKTMRGVWELRELDMQGRPGLTGQLIFRGAGGELAERGSVVFSSGEISARGVWILKADGFGRSQTGKGGVIEKKAIWKLRRAEGTYTYAGRVNVPSFNGQRPDAVIEGPVVQLINGGKPKGGSEKQVGRFQAKLIDLLTEADEEAAVDSAAAGGRPESLQLVCVDGAVSSRSGIPQSCR